MPNDVAFKLFTFGISSEAKMRILELKNINKSINWQIAICYINCL